MKYDLTKFEENLQLINDLISNLTNRSNNLTYLNLLGEYYKTINNYKISDDYEIIVDITRKFVIEIDYLMKKIIVVGLLGNNDDKFVCYFIHNYTSNECNLCKNKTFNVIDFLHKNYLYNSDNYSNNKFIFSYNMNENDWFLDILVENLNDCIKNKERI